MKHFAVTLLSKLNKPNQPNASNKWNPHTISNDTEGNRRRTSTASRPFIFICRRMMKMRSFSPTLAMVAATLVLVLAFHWSLTPVEAGWASSAAAPAQADGLANGIYGPSEAYVSRKVCCINNAIASYIVRLPTNGVPRASITSSVTNGFVLGGNNGLTLRGAIGIFGDPQYNGPPISWVLLTVTDGFSTLSKNITVRHIDSAFALWPGSSFILDTATISNNRAYVAEYMFYQGAAYATNFVNINWSLPGSFAADVGNKLLYATTTVFPLNAHYGTYSGTFTLADGANETYPIQIVTEPEAILQFTFSQTLYNKTPIGQRVATLAAVSDAGIASITFSNKQFKVDLSSGAVFVNETLVAGSDIPLTVIVTSKSGKITTAGLTYTVSPGTIWPASIVGFSQLALNNHKRGQPVGQVTVTGFTPTSWSVFNRNSLVDEYAGAMDYFTINTTGYISCPAAAKLPARTHDVILTATDGPNVVVTTLKVKVDPLVGPVWHVGRGMTAQYGANGFEHLYDVYRKVSVSGQDLPDNVAGFTVLIHYDADPNYYANDNGGGVADWNTRFGVKGPGTFAAFDPKGPRPRVGGFLGSASSGVDMSDKGFFGLESGDITIRGLDISWVHHSGSPDTILINGLSCIRKNAGTWGDLILEDNYIHDCGGNGLETGGGAFDVYLRRNVYANTGYFYIGSGATHNNYIGAASYVEVTDNLFYQTINGHNLKTRALTGYIARNRIFDGERGGASAQIDMPDGGQYVIENNDLMKGPNAQSYSAILFCEEGKDSVGRPMSLTVRNNRINLIMPDNQNWGSGACVSVGKVDFKFYAPGQFLLESNQYYNSTASKQFYQNNVYGYSSGSNPPIIQSNNVALSEPFPLNFTDPGTAFPKAARPGFLGFSWDGMGDLFPNFGTEQIDPGVDDLRIALNAPVGTVMTQMKADGSAIWINSPDITKRLLVHPYENGTYWSLIQGASCPRTGAKYNVAPVGKYLINPTTGVLTLGQALTKTGVDLIVVEAKVACGAFVNNSVWYRFYVAVTADATTTTTINVMPDISGIVVPNPVCAGPSTATAASSTGSVVTAASSTGNVVTAASSTGIATTQPASSSTGSVGCTPTTTALTGLTYVGPASATPGEWLQVSAQTSSLFGTATNPSAQLSAVFSILGSGLDGCATTTVSRGTVNNVGTCQLIAPSVAGVYTLQAVFSYVDSACLSYSGNVTSLFRVIDSGSLSDAITAETQRATTKEATLNTAIISEGTRAAAAELAESTRATSAELTETQRAKAAETAETSRATTAEANEVVRASTVEAALNSTINVESQRAIGKESTLNTAITNEVSRATSAESTEVNRASSAESAETTRATAAESSETTRASAAEVAEASRATNVESNLLVSLLALKNTSDATAALVSSLSSLVSALSARVSTLESTAATSPSFLFFGLSNSVLVSYPTGATAFGPSAPLNSLIRFDTQLTSSSTNSIAYDASTGVATIQQPGVYRLDAFIHLVDANNGAVGTGIVAWVGSTGTPLGPNVLNPNAGGIAQGTTGDDSIVSTIITVSQAQAPFQCKLLLISMNQYRAQITDASTISITRVQ